MARIELDKCYVNVLVVAIRVLYDNVKIDSVEFAGFRISRLFDRIRIEEIEIEKDLTLDGAEV